MDIQLRALADEFEAARGRARQVVDGLSRRDGCCGRRRRDG